MNKNYRLAGLFLALLLGGCTPPATVTIPTQAVTVTTVPSASPAPAATTSPTPGFIPTISPVPGDPLIQEFQAHDGPVTFVGFTPDGQKLVSGSADGIVKFWELSPAPNPVQIFSGHQEGVASLAFSPDGKLMAVGARNGAIKLWDLATGKLTRVLGATARVNQIAFSPDGKVLAAALSDWTVMSWQVPRGRLYWTIEGHQSEFISLAFSKDGEWLVVGEKEGDVLAYRLKTLQVERTYPSYRQGVVGLAFDPDGRLLAIRHGDGYISVHDFESITILKRLGNVSSVDLPVENMVFTPDGSSLAVAAGGVTCWEVASGQQGLSYGVYSDYVTSVAFSPDGKLIIAGLNTGAIWVWEFRH